MTEVHDTTRPVDVVLLGDLSAWSVPLDLDALRPPGPTRRSGTDVVPGSWLAVASVGGRSVGFAAARPVAALFPGRHPRAAALAALGPDRRDEWLGGALEVVELVVTPHVRRERVARALAEVIVTPARARRAWTVVDGHDTWTLGLYTALGWVRVGLAAVGRGPVTLLAPEHPAVRSGSAREDEPVPVPARWPRWPGPAGTGAS